MSFAPSMYPTSLDNTASLPSVTLPAVLDPAFWNDLQAAIFAIETFLGTKPGGWADTDTVVGKIGSGGGGGGDAGWTAAALENSWVNTGGLFADAEFRKLSSGLVVLHGTVQGGVSDSVVLTLPAGYRPLEYCGYLLGCSQAGSVVYAWVYADGTIHVSFGSNPGTVYLDAIQFFAEQ